MSAEGFTSWEDAVRWLLAQPDQAGLVRACYFDEPLRAAAERYADGDEWRELRSWLPAVPGTALDVGAGRGIASYALARDGWTTTALEPDPSSLVGASAIRGLAAESKLEIHVVEERGEELPFADSTFDLVHARQVLHHARDLGALCRECFRVLKPGGMLVATREHVVSSRRQLPAFLAAHPLHRLYGGENAFTLAEYRRALIEARFRIARVVRPWDSVVNYAPFDPESLRKELAWRMHAYPGGRVMGRVLSGNVWFGLALKILSVVDRRPGRLYSFIAMKERVSAR